MLFSLLKAYARLALKIYCRRIVVNQPEWLQAKGPVLFAANHPNSFLDGIILTTLVNSRLYSLARGDAFGPRWKNLLHRLRLLPVYRTSEGVENLGHNYSTFAACQQAFAQGHQVLIFSEGRCINEWHLRPLKKGTARLAISSWQKGLDVTVVPLGFNYSPFRKFGKVIHLNFGQPINKAAVLQHASDGRLLLSFNEQLQWQLQQLVYEINPSDRYRLQQTFAHRLPLWGRLLLVPPALLGFVLHAPLYAGMRAVTNHFFNNDHYDSVMAALHLLLYPLYVLIIGLLAGIFGGWLAALSVVVLAPVCAWACTQLKAW